MAQLRLCLMELGSTESGKGVVEELRNLVPNVWIAGVEKRSDYSHSAFDHVVTTQSEAFFGNYKGSLLPSLAITPELDRLMAPFEGKLLNILGLAATRPTHHYPKPSYGVPLFRDSYAARKDLLTRHILFWNRFFTDYRIDGVIHENLGQEGYDYVALQLARARSIPTLTFNIAGQFPRVLFVQETESGIGDLALGRHLKGADPQIREREASDFIRRSLKETQRSPDAGLKSEPVGYKTHAMISWLFDRSIYVNKGILRSLPTVALRKIVRVLRSPKESFFNLRRSSRLMRISSNNQKEEASVCTDANLSIPYLYFPLHFQPETSTSIKARSFYRLREAVAFVASALPPGFMLLVKEHPHQFRRLLEREEGFYRQIAAIPQVQLIHHSTPNGVLVKSSRAVVCASHSSITAHAILNNKIVISLGDSHFREAPGYFCVRSTEELSTVMSHVVAGTAADSFGRLEEFVTALEASTIEGEFGERPDELPDEEWRRTSDVTRHGVSRLITEWLRLRGLLQR